MYKTAKCMICGKYNPINVSEYGRITVNECGNVTVMYKVDKMRDVTDNIAI